MAINKVVFGNTPVIDLTQVTVTEGTVASGVRFHKSDGTVATGTATTGAEVVGTKLIMPGGETTLHWSTSPLSDIADALQQHRSGLADYSFLFFVWQGEERTIHLNDDTDVVYIFEGREYTIPNQNYKGYSIVPKYIHYYYPYRSSLNPYNVYWDTSDLRPWINGTYYDKFPSDYKALLKQYTSQGGQTDYFCPPSSNDNHGVITNVSGTAQAYWSCTPMNDYSPRCAYYFNGSGNLDYTYTNNNLGVYPIGVI